VTYRLSYRLDAEVIVGTVAFGITEPDDEHEAAMLLRMSAASWISQGCPDVLLLDLSAPIPEEPPSV
jgi:hypothetical protein